MGVVDPVVPLTHLVRLIQPEHWDPIAEGVDGEPKFEVFTKDLKTSHGLSFWQCDGSEQDVFKVSAAAIAMRDRVSNYILAVRLDKTLLEQAQFTWSDIPAPSPIVNLNTRHVELQTVSAPQACSLVNIIRRSIVQGQTTMFTADEIIRGIATHCRGNKYANHLKGEIRAQVEALLR